MFDLPSMLSTAYNGQHGARSRSIAASLLGILAKTSSVVLVLPFVSPSISAQTRESLAPEALYARCKPSVVTILTFDSNRAPLGQGSGFIVGKDRLVTNFHVVAGSSSASIVFDDGSITSVQAVISASAPKDLVVLQAETGKRPALVLGNELQLKEGETIYAIGAPKGLATSFSSGLVSAFRQDEGQFLIQITAPIAPGSSGGPLLNTQGLVVGVTTSRLKEGGFGFAAGASDIQQLLKAPLSVRLQLSDLNSEEAPAPSQASELTSVQALYDQKKFDAAQTSFAALPDSAKNSFDGEILLCKIEQERKDYKTAIDACNAAIQSRPDASVPYTLNAYSSLALGDLVRAESSASRATQLSQDQSNKNLLGLVYYVEEKYDLASKELSVDSDNPFILTLLTGIAFHEKDWDGFRSHLSKLVAVKGKDNGWTLFSTGVAAERDLKWDLAVESYKKCDADSDFIDPVCIVEAANAEIREGQYSAAKSDIDKALVAHPRNLDAVSAGMFINLVVGNLSEADRLHEILEELKPANLEFNECLYYYGRNEPLLATDHCQAAIKGNENNNTVWSNAGYVALDNGDFQTALTYFAKAWQLFYASKEKHTATEELDLWWGTIAAEYYSGDKKKAKSLYRALKKTYPQFMRTIALKQLPLVWSEGTVKLIDKVATELK
jgi:S1-C subfamily serine protease/Flp pilus assembly protein TadD